MNSSYDVGFEAEGRRIEPLPPAYHERKRDR